MYSNNILIIIHKKTFDLFVHVYYTNNDENLIKDILTFGIPENNQNILRNPRLLLIKNILNNVLGLLITIKDKKLVNNYIRPINNLLTIFFLFCCFLFFFFYQFTFFCCFFF